MRFKKIEIQGFRAYQEKENATFNFMLNYNDIADFISIYAPNGFGKTSFYDAVEWAVTDKIKRIDDTHKYDNLTAIEKRKNSNNYKKRYKQNLISNNDPKFKLKDRYVEFFTDSQFLPYKKKMIKAIKKGQTDYDFKASIKNEFFRDVILSQEGIDSFLKAEKGEDRYKLFIDYFDDENLNKIYNNISELIKENNLVKDQLIADFNKIKKSFTKKVDESVINKATELITYLKKNGIDIKDISKDVDFEQFALFSSNLQGIKNRIDLGESSQLSKLNRKKYLIEDLIKKFQKYIDTNKELKSISNQINTNQKNIKYFIEIEYIKNILKKLNKKIEIIKNELEIRVFLNSNFDKYQKQLIEINEKKERILSNNDLINKFKNYIINLHSNITFFETKIKINSDEINKQDILISKTKSNFKEYNNIIKLISSSEEKIKKLININEIEEDKLKKVEVFLMKNKTLQKNVTDNLFDFNTDNHIFNNFLSDLNDLNIFISIKEKEILSLNQKLNQNKKLEDNIAYLTELGTKIAKESLKSSCPLCKQDYNSLEDLLNNIEKNKIINENINQLTLQLNVHEEQLKKDNKQLSNKKEELLNSINQILNKEKEEYNIISSSNEINLKSLEKENEFHSKYKLSISHFGDKYKNLKVEDVLMKIEDRINSLKNKNTIYSENRSKYLSRVEVKNNKILKLKKEIKQSNNDLELYYKDDFYNQYLNFLKVLDITNVSKELLLKIKEKTDDKLNQINVLIKESKDNLNQINKKVEKFDKNQLEYKLEIYKDKLRAYSSLIKEYEYELKSLNINTENVSEGLIKNELEKIVDKISINEDSLRIISQLDKLSEEIKDYMQFKKKENEKVQIDLKLNKHINLGKDLKENKEIVWGRIQKMIKDFFYDDLINDIYKKIDSHPDYKKISFIPEFNTTDKPSLNVFISKEEENNQEYIPSLYLSTAQLNVLSLSIFLARALHTKDDNGNPVNCIFIDDPIQSMDSINILSIIDLLRNLIINYNKQIIISTHDENFHDLLQRKIPREFYKSKFLKLETFGKLEKDYNPKID